MPGKKGYFEIGRDKVVINTGGFLCRACLVGKPAQEISPDPRYCRDCYNSLLDEASLLPAGKRPAWIPKNGVRAANGGQGTAEKPIPVPMHGDGIMKRRGRPRKETADISRVTRWRRQKEAQGVML